MASGLVKNFSYGELWQGKEIPVKPKGKRTEMPAYKITSNVRFLEFLHDNGYKVYLDEAYQGYAHTNVDAKEIVLNANFPDHLLEVFLKHELGHLILFNVNQFTTVRPNTMRSIITRELYTPDKVLKYGFRQLLFVENVIQDIIIETVSNEKCVCISLLQEEGANAGVKHLQSLESIGHVAKETCDTLLVPVEQWKPPTDDFLEALAQALQSMLKDLKADMQEISDKITSVENADFLKPLQEARRAKENKFKQQLNKIEEIEKLKGSLTPKLERAKELLEQELDKLEQEALTEQITAAEKKERAKKALEKKLARDEELKELLEEEIEAADAAREKETSKTNGLGADSSTDQTHETTEVDGEISKNLTDHLLEETPDGGSTHSFDCGLPTAVTVSRNDSHINESALTVIDTSKKVRKIVVHDDAVDKQTLGRTKTAEKELTYHKSAKREWDETDMMKGKRRLRMSGVNVLIGLDVSGSMTSEWGGMFTEMSNFVNGLKGNLDIENVYYFTYHHHLKEWSDDISKLSLSAWGGNAFGYVYQEVMQEVPILQRNEILLVTDCGDNLGFNLQDVCEVSRNGEAVENHISIIDTEGSGFYVKEGFNEKEWSLYNMHDGDLYRNISGNIERLIEK